MAGSARLLSGIDDHSRYVVCATVLAVPSARAVADAFVAAMKAYGVPAEVLTDNGKQFTGRFTKPRPAEVLFERVCREHGITAKLTKLYSPTTTGKVERWHQTLRRELLDVAGPFADLPSAQAAITAWVHTYNHARPHQALGMATPASLFRPGSQPGPVLAGPVPEPAPEAAGPAPVLIGAQSAGAVEFDTVISASGVLAVIPAVQRIKLGPERARQLAHVWADEFTVHVLIGGQLVKTVPSCLDAEDLATLKLRGASPAGPPPAAPAPRNAAALPGGTVIEVDRSVDGNGVADLAGHRVKAGAELARRRVTLRLDGHLVHVISDGVLAKTLASPIPASDRGKLRGARIAAAALPAPAPGPVSVQRKVPRDGVIMVTRQRLRVGATYAGKIVTVHVEDTHFRVTCDGAEISLHPRPEQRPSQGGKPRSTPRNPSARPASPEPVNQVVSRNCQGSPETTHHNQRRYHPLRGPVPSRRVDRSRVRRPCRRRRDRTGRLRDVGRRRLGRICDGGGAGQRSDRGLVAAPGGPSSGQAVRAGASRRNWSGLRARRVASTGSSPGRAVMTRTIVSSRPSERRRYSSAAPSGGP